MTNGVENTLQVRPALETDATELCALLNEIIAIGGSTAYQAPLTADEFTSKFLAGSGLVSCFVAVGPQADLLGFQWLERKDNLPDGWGDIATFAKANSSVRGVGTALFEETKASAINAGISTINATIRADNVSGLAYYSKMGFVDYNLIEAVALSDGTLVDRVQKRCDLD